MRLHVVNYRGYQVHSAVSFKRVVSLMILFEGEAFADLGDLTSEGPVRFVAPGEDGYLPAGSTVGTGITVTDVAEDGKTATTRTSDSTTATAGDGKYAIKLGDPRNPNRGVQIGGGVQINHFYEEG